MRSPRLILTALVAAPGLALFVTGLFLARSADEKPRPEQPAGMGSPLISFRAAGGGILGAMLAGWAGWTAAVVLIPFLDGKPPGPEASFLAFVLGILGAIAGLAVARR